MCFEVDDLDGVVPQRGAEQTAVLRVERQVIEAPLHAGEGDCCVEPQLFCGPGLCEKPCAEYEQGESGESHSGIIPFGFRFQRRITRVSRSWPRMLMLPASRAK